MLPDGLQYFVGHLWNFQKSRQNLDPWTPHLSQKYFKSTRNFPDDFKNMIFHISTLLKSKRLTNMESVVHQNLGIRFRENEHGFSQTCSDVCVGNCVRQQLPGT